MFRNIAYRMRELMDAYAVVETGGKQYIVKKGSVLDVELLGAEAGNKVKLGRVLAVSDGKELTIGTSEVHGVAVTAEVIENRRGPKVISFKKKRRKGFHKKIGHRQGLARIRIEGFGAQDMAQIKTEDVSASPEVAGETNHGT
jgi:large subunit ribosomal protein L21